MKIIVRMKTTTKNRAPRRKKLKNISH